MSLELALEERESVDAGIRHIEFLEAEIAAVERLIAQQALSGPEIRRLMTVPGINVIGAASFIGAVGDPNWFLTSRSPAKRRRARVAFPSGGSASARWALVESALDRCPSARTAARVL